MCFGRWRRIVPGLGEARQAYKVAEKAGDLAGMKKALEQGAAIATKKVM